MKDNEDALAGASECERMAPFFLRRLESKWSDGNGGLVFVPSKSNLQGNPYRLSTAQISRWIDGLVSTICDEDDNLYLT